MASSCCICHCQLNAAKGKGWHEKVRSCLKERPVWEQFAKECGCFDTIERAFQHDTSAFLYYSYIERAKKLVEFQQQLNGQKKEMATILGCSVSDVDVLSNWIIIVMTVPPCTLLHNRHGRLTKQVKE